MQIKVSRSILSGEIRANRSKSYTQRAYAIAALAKGPSVIGKPSWSDDGCAALGVACDLGAAVDVSDQAVTILPGRHAVRGSWSVGESGLSLRMFAPIAARFDQPVEISGYGTLLNRPVGLIADALGSMGVTVTGKRLPLTVRGPIRPGHYEVDGSLSSQLITGLLIAMPTLPGNSELTAQNLRSTPYIEMTLDIMHQFGVDVEYADGCRFDIPGNQEYAGTEYGIEADWSGLAFPLVAGTLCGNVRISDVDPQSLQADRAIVDVLEMCGARLTWEGSSVHVLKSELTAFEFDATDCPDLFPPLVILAARCEGISRIKGVHRLTYKESNRAEVLRDEFGKLGVQLAISGDEMIVVGLQQVNGGEVDARGDHRIAMALTLAGMVAQQDIVINGAESISKSYPGFYADIRALRGRLSGPEELFDRRGSGHFSKDLAQHHK